MIFVFVISHLVSARFRSFPLASYSFLPAPIRFERFHYDDYNNARLCAQRLSVMLNS